MTGSLRIRDFQPRDLEGALALAALSFAEDFELLGTSAEGFASQARAIARLRMVPFRLSLLLARYKVIMLVAEWAGQVVGFAMANGRKSLNLSMLMVHPDHRRQGIGQALLRERLRRAQALGFRLATASVLAANAASLGNLHKQGFAVFNRYHFFERGLEGDAGDPPAGVRLRQVRRGDRALIDALHREIAGAEAYGLQDPAMDAFFPSLGDRLLDRLEGSRRWAVAVELGGETIGYLSGVTGSSSRMAHVHNPLLPEAHAALLPALLEAAAQPLQQQGKSALHLTLSGERPASQAALLAAGWKQTATFVELARRLD